MRILHADKVDKSAVVRSCPTRTAPSRASARTDTDKCLGHCPLSGASRGAAGLGRSNLSACILRRARLLLLELRLAAGAHDGVRRVHSAALLAVNEPVLAPPRPYGLARSGLAEPDVV